MRAAQFDFSEFYRFLGFRTELFAAFVRLNEKETPHGGFS
jgi:hypothetical protein